jgi:predicted ATPase
MPTPTRSALSPSRQVEFLKLLRSMDQSGICQVNMAPILTAYPNARLLRLTKYGLEPVALEQTERFRLIRESCADPASFVATMLEE